MTAFGRQETLTRRLSGAAILVAREAPIIRLIFRTRRRRPMSKVFEVLKRLGDANVHYFIGRYRTDTIDDILPPAKWKVTFIAHCQSISTEPAGRRV
ncbi:hypothetical protein E0H61_07810 [Rhizobium leguminosarum bv. viciae]|jgi:hypothetical protein|nr:hypothetical protein E0H44_16085 [Rhizobium leguminosarum bv. viciae]TBZ84736.1 hypothetical protein E0H61_07810 [Rhizobium leguminosarum bv. viciae]TCA17592.1 hypothetical protein E0H68_07410 [Rhizobium leguminosarum bv. viciae]TCA21738.1 hypothetical protein E0H67_17395 [Rhizobium leguminosarum bv. viciae]